MDKMNSLTRRQLLIYGSAFIGSAFISPCLSRGLSQEFLNNTKGNNTIKGNVFLNDGPLKLWKWSKKAYCAQHVLILVCLARETGGYVVQKLILME